MALLALILRLLALTIPIYIASRSYKLYLNYQNTSKTNLRLIISFFEPTDVTFLLLRALLAPIFSTMRWARILNPTWSWQDDFKNHQELGESFIVVTPRRNVMYSADAVVVEQVLGKRKVWIKPAVYEVIELFGKNVDTVNGDDWARHRKLTAPCFNERVSSFVWDESLRQATSMISSWLSQPSGKVTTMVDDTRVVALHVISAAGFGVSHDFHGGARNLTEGHTLSYSAALMVVLDLIPSIIVSKMPWLKSVPDLLLPQKVKSILEGTREFTQYMDEMLAGERKIMAENPGTAKPNLVSTLIRTSDEAMASGEKSSVRLSDDEIKGNMFIFNLAGHDTTANTLAYAVALLAVYPEVQEWVLEEVEEAFKENGEGKLVYEEVFPRMTRCMAVMYETLRLYGPVPIIPRAPFSSSTPLTLSSPTPDSPHHTTTIIVPPNTEISLNIHGMQTNPSTFPSPSVWNPRRWISTSAISSTDSASTLLANESLIHPPLGYAPWASGPRVCPGMKFAQVEFAAVLATVLRRAEVRACGLDGSDSNRKELEGLVRDSSLEGPTLKLRKPGSVLVQVVKR